jgi:hypothetical protein
LNPRRSLDDTTKADNQHRPESVQSAERISTGTEISWLVHINDYMVHFVAFTQATYFVLYPNNVGVLETCMH